jgi:hypothetical protein
MQLLGQHSCDGTAAGVLVLAQAQATSLAVLLLIHAAQPFSG